MPYELFEHEARVVDDARALIKESSHDSERLAEACASLLKEYEKLFRTTRRLVRMSDRSEAELNRLARDLDEKNQMLESLSSKLSKYLSPQVYNSIFKGERDVAIATERKKLTVFFSDIKDFTATTSDLEPEDLTFLLNDYLTEMSTIALQHGATIDKFIGDAMLLFFGDPETRGVKEDAAACVRMALAMQRRMVELRRRWREAGYEKPFQMRVGVNTGYCNVGNFGSNDRMDYTIIGGEVNLAARLESIAEPGGITMAYETYALVRDLVHAQPGDPIMVKGIPREVVPYKVIGLRDEIGQTEQFVHYESDGMQLFVDLDRLKGNAKRAAIRELERTIEAMRSRRRRSTRPAG